MRLTHARKHGGNNEDSKQNQLCKTSSKRDGRASRINRGMGVGNGFGHSGYLVAGQLTQKQEGVSVMTKLTYKNDQTSTDEINLCAYLERAADFEFDEDGDFLLDGNGAVGEMEIELTF